MVVLAEKRRVSRARARLNNSVILHVGNSLDSASNYYYYYYYVLTINKEPHLAKKASWLQLLERPTTSNYEGEKSVLFD